MLLRDREAWVPLDPDPEAAYRKGLLRFTLHKLRGSWALVRMGDKAADKRRENWLLIKERARSPRSYGARRGDITVDAAIIDGVADGQGR